MFLLETDDDDDDDGIGEAGRQLLEVIDRFMAWIVVIIPCVYLYFQAYQVVYIYHAQLLVCQK